MEKTYPVIEFNEEDRFKPYYIKLSELVYGRNFQSPGGEAILRQIISSNVEIADLRIEKGLDIGTGCGGNAIFLYNEFKCAITAVEINDAFIRIAKQRVEEIAPSASISFLNQSILDFHESERYDIAICRDVLMYLSDKYNALINIYNSLRQNGKLILIDYCKNENTISEGFKGYIDRGGYDLLSIDEYSKLFATLDFRRVVIKDLTEEYIHHLQLPLSSFSEIEKEADSFAEKDLRYIEKRSSDKIQYCREGSMSWVGIFAEK